ncbi:MAG TPA: hypothetical protein VGM23_06550, partial [Armatimonadota bacterium]
MKTMIRPLIIFAFLLTTLGLLFGPAAAQQPDPQRKAGGVPSLSGRILAINAQQRALQLSLYVRADSPDAPGNVPLVMQQRATSLNTQADDLEKKAAKLGDSPEKTQLLQRAADARKLAMKLLTWREVEYTFALADSRAQLIGIRKAQINEVAKGAHLRLEVTMPNGATPTAGQPLQAVLANDAFQVDNEIPSGIQNPEETPGRLGDRRSERHGDITYYVVVGEVVQSTPVLVVSVNDQLIQIANPNRNIAWKQQPLTPRDFQPGLQVRARVKMRGPLE